MTATRPPAAGWRRLLDDGLAYAGAHIDDGGDRLFASSDFGSQTDPCCVQHGAAGLLAVLDRAHQARGGDDLAAVVRRTAEWIDQRRTDVPRLLPGLYFGRSGTAWTLFDVARRLGDEAMAERALALALAIPVRWPNPDVCHGIAGAGMAMLHLWQQTKDTAFRDRLESCVDGLLETATHDGDRVYWRIPADFDSEMAGLAQYGFGHGVAGIGSFLLAAGTTLGRSDCLGIARRAGDTLVAVAVGQAGGAYWPSSVDGATAGDVRYHWSNGSSGVGTFLLRLWQATGEARYLTLSERAAITVRRVRWRSNPSACHGLAGDGDFLLDLAGAVDPKYHDWAEELAECLYARHAVRDGHAVLPDMSGTNVFLDYSTGLAGVLGFLLRLNHGGPRWWTPDTACTDRPQPCNERNNSD